MPAGRMPSAAVSIVALTLLSLVPQAASATARSRDPALAGRYLVVYRASAGNVDAATDRRERARGFHARFRYRRALRGFAAHLSDAQVRELRDDPQVAYVAPDRAVHARGGVPLADGELVPTGVRRIGAATETSVSPAADVGVAVVDTGIDLSHPDLDAVSATNCVSPGQPAGDDAGHGTHVAGTIGARNTGAGVVGVAPGTRLYAVKVLDSNGDGTWSQVICGLDWVAAHPSDVRVANLSLGGLGSNDNDCGNTDDDPLHQAVCRVVDAGVSIVAATGNQAWDIGDAPPDVPSTYPEVMAVTAMSDTDGRGGGSGGTCGDDADDTAASFSNFATRAADVSHLIAAPGVCIRSTWLGGKYAIASGTSMATPHVAGAIALCLGEGGSPGPCAAESPAQIIQHLRADAQAAEDQSLGFVGDPLRPMEGGEVFGYLLRVPAGPAGATSPTQRDASISPSPATTTTGQQLPRLDSTLTDARDRFAPIVSISAAHQRLASIRRRGLRLPLRCSERCTLTVRLVLDGRTARRLGLSRGAPATIGRATLVLAGGRVATATLRLTVAARRSLAETRTVAVQVRALGADDAGNHRSTARRLVLRR